jgi:PAS domain S-box-containing protein
MEDAQDYAIFLVDRKGRVMDWTHGSELVFGYGPDEIIGRSVNRLQLRTKSAAGGPRNCLGLAAKTGRSEDEGWWVRRDGSKFWGHCIRTTLPDDRGSKRGFAIIVRDLSERRQAEDNLRRSEQLMRAILDTAADAIITIDRRGMVRSINTATEGLFGYTAAELVGQNVNRLMPEPFHGEHDQYIRNYCRTGRAKIIGIGREVTGQRKDGTTFPMHLSVSEVQLKDRRLFTGIVHDLTERRRLERQIMEAAANEQRRIGHDLHDGLCQDLVGIAFGIDAVARSLSSPAQEKSMGRSMVKLAASVREAAGLARRLAHGLNPVDLKAGGLPTALENLALKVAESFGVVCTFHWDHLAQVREDATATHLYRIAQEAVGNAIRHGKARKIQISLIERGTTLILSITDNGKGISQAIADSVKQGLAPTGRKRSPSAGMGLQTMHYRARVLGGSFMVMPGRRRGTIITCTIGRDQFFHLSTNPHKASGKVPRPKHASSR